MIAEPGWVDGDDVARGRVWECQECGADNAMGEVVCDDCGHIDTAQAERDRYIAYLDDLIAGRPDDQ